MMKFLVGYNGSGVAKAALFLAGKYAAQFKAKIFVVTSMAGGQAENPNDIDRATQDLEFAEKYLNDKGIECETHQLVRGRPAGEDLVSYAEENDIDQIFVGIEKKSKTQKILLGSNAQYIILKAPCPVVSVSHSST
jgi:nucleotide-binding universal stress UspA family protein